MFRILIDTSVWLDLAKDQRHAAVLGVIEEMVKLGMVTLIVPSIVLDEFRRNRERIAKESAKEPLGALPASKGRGWQDWRRQEEAAAGPVAS